MKQRQQQTDAFKVKTESGKTYGIEEFTHQIYQEFLNPADNGWADGIKEFKVVGGGRANRKSSNEYEIVATGEIAVRI
ncbi:hypothetical protein [Pseudomonas wadenswilerensis]|uniref:Uncharacterized protein n=1 Tax=Pseudomonas wadenswilerensis TaxID=1785161 RepID=A0A380SZM5_9PSED|nr:hypothetical protein [Pseudomonas wadenswilerensis]SUQ62686.1 hypothetical protein CCOS864_02132 [Pseudomonas wadenswilerensis]